MQKIARRNKGRVRALFRKEFYQMIRDPSSILISVVLPAILLFIYGYGVSLDIKHLRVGIVMQDSAPDAQSFVQSLSGSRFFEITIRHDVRAFTEDIIKGKIRGIVVIPPYFSQFRYRGSDVAPIQVIADGSEPNTANFVQNYVNAAWQNWLVQEAISEKLKVGNYMIPQPRYWYNEELESRYFLVPGSLAIIMTLIGTLLTALVVSREWERGTMEALMSTPVTITELLIGKIVPYFFLGMLSMAICVLIAVFFYQIPFRGSYLLLALISGAFLLTALGIGLLISTLCRNQFVAAQASMVAAFLPGFILSGFIFEITSMPLPTQFITYIIPARYFVSCLQTLFLVGNVWGLLLKNLLFLLGFSSLLFCIIAKITVKRLD